MLPRIFQILLPLLTTAVLLSRFISHWSLSCSPSSLPSHLLTRPWCCTRVNLVANLIALTTAATHAVAENDQGTYSNVDHEALRRRQERKEQQRVREQKERARQKQEEKQRAYRQQQQQQQRRGQFQSNPFGGHHGGGGGDGDGFQHIFEQFFGGGGGGPGGFQFSFDGHGMPFGHGQRRPPPSGDESSDPRFIRKALKSFGLTDSTDPQELKRTYRRLAIKYHPDKCKGPDCEEKMVKVNRYRDAIEQWLKERG